MATHNYVEGDMGSGPCPRRLPKMPSQYSFETSGGASTELPDIMTRADSHTNTCHDPPSLTGHESLLLSYPALQHGSKDRLNSPQAVSFGPVDSRSGPGMSQFKVMDNPDDDGDRDNERLRQLGYDAVLGRPLGFWSSMGLNLCNMDSTMDIVTLVAIYSYSGPILFIAAYPFLGLLHLALLMPFCELASAFPVAGAMATWAWRCALGGVRGERGWGWLMSGFVLAAHLGRLLGGLYETVRAWAACYSLAANFQVSQDPNITLAKKYWWMPIFHVVLVTFVAILSLSRIARSAQFWIICGFYSIVASLLLIGILAATVYTVRHLPGTFLGMTKPPTLPNLGWMIWLNFPLQLTPLDASAHLAEETQNPAVNVPRAIFVSYVLRFIFTYASVILFSFIPSPQTVPLLRSTLMPFIPVAQLLGIPSGVIMLLVILVHMVAVVQLLAQLQVTSRFLFALARDHGIPFSRLFLITDKHKEPWVASVVLILIMYASIFAWFIKANLYTSLLVTFTQGITPFAYLVPIALYVVSKLNLKHERTQFTLGKWSKPIAVIAVIWLFASMVQQSFPTAYPVTKDTMSLLPPAFVGMLLIMFMTWIVYGRRHYVGPIRVFTKWTAGTEIDPGDFTTSAGRAKAIQMYKREGKSEPRTGSRGWRSLFSGSKSPPTGNMAGSRSTDVPEAIPESGLLPETVDMSVLPESGLLPASQVGANHAATETIPPVPSIPYPVPQPHPQPYPVPHPYAQPYPTPQPYTSQPHIYEDPYLSTPGESMDFTLRPPQTPPPVRRASSRISRSPVRGYDPLASQSKKQHGGSIYTSQTSTQSTEAAQAESSLMPPPVDDAASLRGVLVPLRFSALDGLGHQTIFNQSFPSSDPETSFGTGSNAQTGAETEFFIFDDDTPSEYPWAAQAHSHSGHEGAADRGSRQTADRHSRQTARGGKGWI